MSNNNINDLLSAIYTFDINMVLLNQIFYWPISNFKKIDILDKVLLRFLGKEE